VNTSCTNCGARLREGASFCLDCGSPTEPSKTSRPKQRGQREPLGERTHASLAPPALRQQPAPEAREPRAGSGQPIRGAGSMGDIKRLVRALIHGSIIHVDDLPRGVRVLALLGYAGLLLLVVAALLFEWLGTRPVVPLQACMQEGGRWLCFGDNNVMWAASIPALLTFIIIYLVGWAFVLTGASDCRPFVFLPIVGLFVAQLFFLPSGLGRDVVFQAWGSTLFLMSIPIGLYIFSHRLRYWRDLPLLEFAAWLFVVLGFAVSLLLIHNFAVPLVTLLNVRANSRFVLETLWFLLALQMADVAVTTSRLVVAWLRRSLTGVRFRRLVTALLLARPVISIAMLFLTGNDFWLTDYMVSLLLIGFVWRLGVGARPLVGKTAILLLILLSLSALAFLIAVPGVWLGRFYFVLAPLALAPVWFVLERRWSTRTAATLLALSLAWPVIVLAFTLVFSGQGDFLEAFVNYSISEVDLPQPAVVLFVVLAAYNLLSTGARYANTEGRVVPRTGRVLLVFGAIISATGLFMFSATVRDSATGVLDESLQAGLELWFAFGTFFLAAPYLAWTAWTNRERLIGGEEPRPVGWQPNGWWIVIGVLFGVLATRLLVWEFGLNPLFSIGIVVGIVTIVSIAARARGVSLANIIVGGGGSLAGMVMLFLIDILGRV
jgi:hypothetical protein